MGFFYDYTSTGNYLINTFNICEILWKYPSKLDSFEVLQWLEIIQGKNCFTAQKSPALVTVTLKHIKRGRKGRLALSYVRIILLAL